MPAMELTKLPLVNVGRLIGFDMGPVALSQMHISRRLTCRLATALSDSIKLPHTYLPTKCQARRLR